MQLDEITLSFLFLLPRLKILYLKMEYLFTHLVSEDTGDAQIVPYFIYSCRRPTLCYALSRRIHLLMNNLLKTLKGSALALSLVFGFILLTGADASAQNRDRDYRNDDRYENDRYRDNRNRRDDDDVDRYNGRDRNGNQSVRYAMRKGYNEGFKQGMRDSRRNRRGTSGGWNGDNGRNNSRNGDYRMQQAYRDGYSRGYRDGVNRNRNINRGNSNGRTILGNILGY